MAPHKPMAVSRPASRSRAAAENNFKDKEVILLWKLNNKGGDIAAVAKELNITVGAARIRWFRLKAKLEAFEKKVAGKETTTTTTATTTAAAAAAAPVDTTMEDTEGAEETDEVEGGNNDEDAK
ncbi:hypothetical protein N7516_000050 [Penicillium verrucosum]|uniref:uncharacterized protein n=1 Tax=Penicillium verrucosum TaxID=60171 RepID=UPI0025451FE3|nr:uncharacterized protein N7516_000050 [Penicillium verrucosum]KAJ5939882.1 hypothetical protein N7516_000050 [Penicillium verrucosum]